MTTTAKEAEKSSDSECDERRLVRMFVNGSVGHTGALQGFFLDVGVILATAFDGCGELFAGSPDLVVHDFLGGFEENFGVFSEGVCIVTQRAGGFKMLFKALVFHGEQLVAESRVTLRQTRAAGWVTGPSSGSRTAGYRPHGATFIHPWGVFFIRSAVLRGFIAAQAGQRGQCLVRGFFLVQRLLKEIRGFVIAELVSPFGQAAIGSDFVVFDFLGGADEGRVDRRTAFVTRDNFIGFLDEANNGFAFPASNISLEGLEDSLEPDDVIVGFIKMPLEGISQLCMRGGASQLGQGARETDLAIVHVRQLI
jgi:hypothetical protein